MKKALCCGKNLYGGQDLSECINDAIDMEQMLIDEYGFEVEVLTNAQVTVNNVTEKLKSLAAISEAGDHIVWSYSGHGTQSFDASGDDGDGYDEALFLDTVWRDDDIRKVLNLFPVGVHLVVIFDSCFSRTATKKKATDKIRFYKTDNIPLNLPRKKALLSELPGLEVLISGCDDDESSYDASDLGNGAFTYYFLKSLEYGVTFEEMYVRIRKYLPTSRYPQTPYLEGAELHRPMFMSSIVSDIPDVPNEEPEEEPITLTFWQKLWKWVQKLFGYDRTTDY